jgi:hypothetical protein
MMAGTIQSARDIGMRTGPHDGPRDTRLQGLSTEHGHVARPGLCRATHEYQRESSSKRPASSAPSIRKHNDRPRSRGRP